MKTTYSVHAAKTNLSRLLEWAEAGDEVVIARGHTPVVRLTLVNHAPPRRRFGAMRGRAKVTPAYFEPLPPDDLVAGSHVRLLLDTHALFWWLDGDWRLTRRARSGIADEENVIFVSAASAWEITTKSRLGKLTGAGAVAADVVGSVASQAFSSLDITLRHAQRAGRLPGAQRDPFDRMLIAQAQLEDLTLVSRGAAFDAYGVSRLW